MDYSPRKGVLEVRGLHSPKLSQLIALMSDPDDITCWAYNVESDVAKDWFFREAVLDGRVLRCQVSAVLEPLKVRLITKGESIPYYFARSMQKSMHTYLRKKTPRVDRNALK